MIAKIEDNPFCVNPYDVKAAAPSAAPSASQSSNSNEVHFLGVLHSTEVAYELLTQQPRIRFSAIPKNFSLDGAEIY